MLSDTKPPRYHRRGHHYLELLRCPLDGSPLVWIDDATLTSEMNPSQIYRLEDGIFHLLTEASQKEFAALSDKKEQDYIASSREKLSPEAFKSLPQTAPPGWPVAYWQHRAYSMAALWRVMEAARIESGELPIAPVGTAVDFTDGMGWPGYGLDVAGYVTVVVSQDAGDFGLRAYPYARYCRVHAGFETLPLASGVFDLVVFSFSLHLLKKPEITLKQAAQLLSEGGYMVVMPDVETDVPLRQMAERVMEESGLEVRRERPKPMSRGIIRKTVERASGRVPAGPPIIVGKRTQ